MNKKIQNGREMHLLMNKKQNDYQNVNKTYFYYLCLETDILYDLGPETNIFAVYCSSSDL